MNPIPLEGGGEFQAFQPVDHLVGHGFDNLRLAVAHEAQRADAGFLADGDALIIPQKDLVRILNYLKSKIKGIERVGIYANARDILKKSVEELNELKALAIATGSADAQRMLLNGWYSFLSPRTA
jgi:hypothetical protein